MLIHPMVERLRGLGLAAMADAFLDLRNQSAADDLSREDWLGLLTRPSQLAAWSKFNALMLLMVPTEGRHHSGTAQTLPPVSCAAILGGGCAGNVSFRWCSNNAWSVFGSV